MAAPANCGESDMATEDFCLNLSPLPSPRWSPLCFPPSPPRPFLPSSGSMVMQNQGSNQSMDNPPQNQEHDDMVDQAPYFAGDSALLQQLRQNWSEASDWGPGGGIMNMNNQGFEESNMGFEEESEGMMMTCFYFPPSSPTYFPLYRPMPSVFVVSSNIQDINLALSCQHILEDKSGALHVINKEEGLNIIDLLFDGFTSYLDNKFGYLHVTARVAVLESLVDYVLDEDKAEMAEVTLRRINWLEQHDENIVDQPVIERVGMAHQLIQNRGGELNVIFGGGVFTVNGLEYSDGQASPATPETLLICRANFSFRVWLGHDSQWAAEIRIRCNRLNTGSFTTMEDAISAYEMVVRWSGWEDLTAFPGLFENENRSKLSPQLPPTAQEKKRGEDFGLVRCNATGNDEIEAVGTGSEGTGDCVIADQARLNSGCLGKRKTKEKSLGGERRNKKINGVRIAIPLEDILQTKGMRFKDAANHPEVSSIPELKSSCWDYDIQRWPPHNERKLIRQSLTNEIPVFVDQEGLPQLTSHNGPFDHAFTATIDTNSVDKEIPLSQFLPTAQQENPDADFGNDAAEAIKMGSEGTWEGVMEEGQLDSGCSGKNGKRKVNTLGGERGNNITTGVRIAITMEDILKVKGMPLNDAAEHFEVSRSTLKRACREYGIKRWPPRKEHELINQTRPNESPAIVDQVQIPELNFDMVLPSNQPRKEHELINQTRPNESPVVVDQEQAPQLNSDTVLPSHQVSARPNESPAVVDQEQIPQLNSYKVLPSTQVSTTIDTKSVKLKARYEEVTIAFRLSRPFRKVELEQEVKKRLPLEAGTYNINYKDEDDDFILISCNEDLEECISSSSPLGSRCHELFLKPK